MNSTTLQTAKAPWDEVRFAPGECRRWQVGPLDLWVRRTEYEWHLFSALHPERECALMIGEKSEMPPDGEYRRFASDESRDAVKLIPVFPDRPIVAKPELGLAIPPGCEALFFAGIPASYRVIVCGKRELALADEATMVLSNTWFGGPTEGELGYALQTRASRDATRLRTGIWRVICPVFIRNKSDEVLDFQRLCLRVKHISIYYCREYQRLWGSQCNVRYLSEDKTSEIEYAGKAPSYEEGLVLLQKAQEKPDKGGFIARTFGGAGMRADLD